MDSLTDTLIQELNKYTGVGANAIAVPVYDREHQHYAVAVFDYPDRKQPGDMMIMARVVGGKIVIEEDHTDKMLVDALLQQGVPRDKIILAYEGESAPEFELSKL